ncbi:hypothetical protein EYF80_043098 [Liparis tanakae]|uniref:Uncharacterized protein n=1 Tax=Liparis tanakae TaxID=230148 RepID=A0A4Z2G0K1_9TELE|nr:hypothetical protein EYF80_043098 [Liparis tanakae]
MFYCLWLLVSSLVVGSCSSSRMKLSLEDKVDELLHPGGPRVQAHLLPVGQSSSGTTTTGVKDYNSHSAVQAGEAAAQLKRMRLMSLRGTQRESGHYVCCAPRHESNYKDLELKKPSPVLICAPTPHLKIPSSKDITI